MELCIRCLVETNELFKAPCQEDPLLQLGAPIGMYHCPDCDAMILAGFPHPKLCLKCIEELEALQ